MINFWYQMTEPGSGLVLSYLYICLSKNRLYHFEICLCPIFMFFLVNFVARLFAKIVCNNQFNNVFIVFTHQLCTRIVRNTLTNTKTQIFPELRNWSMTFLHRKNILSSIFSKNPLGRFRVKVKNTQLLLIWEHRIRFWLNCIIY